MLNTINVSLSGTVKRLSVACHVISRCPLSINDNSASASYSAKLGLRRVHGNEYWVR